MTPPWRDSFEARTYQAFLAGLKHHWGGELYREVVVAAETQRASDPTALEQAMRTRAAYRLYAYLERRIQQMKWSGRYGFVTLVEDQRAALEAYLDAAHPGAQLHLDASLAPPDYVRATETHQQPGGLWGDPLGAVALAWYATGLSFAGTSPDALVDWYARLVAAHAPCAAPRILDLGCTSGRSTRAIKRALPAAEVIGCDVCAAPLRFGARQGDAVTLMQQSAERLEFSDASIDIVASHWLLHELPPRAIRAAIAEARRVLKPGGVFIAYDMLLVPGGVVGEWLHSGYAARNNEPFAHTLMRFDLRGALAQAGFTAIELALTMPEHPGPDAPAALPARRLHYMSLACAKVPTD